jgi:hypothetical protein
VAYCTHCGAEMADEARICPTCNRPRQVPAPPPVPPAGQPTEVPAAPTGPADPTGPTGPTGIGEQAPAAGTQAFPGGQVARRTDGGAVTSLVLGILGIVFCPLILSIPAIIVGRSSERRIRESGGMLDGEGLAKAGWITGIVGTVYSVLIILFFILMFALVGSVDGPPGDPGSFFDLLLPPR